MWRAHGLVHERVSRDRHLSERCEQLAGAHVRALRAHAESMRGKMGTPTPMILLREQRSPLQWVTTIHPCIRECVRPLKTWDWGCLVGVIA